MKKNLILLKQLLGLKEVIDAGQIQKAAIKNGFRQSNLSRLITTLENEAGCCLLNRSSSGVTPTNTAQLLYDEIQKIYDILSEIQTSFIKSDDLSGTLNVWTEVGIVGSYIITNLSDFYAKYPKIRLNILTESNVDLKNVDIAILDVQKHTIPLNVEPLFAFRTKVRFCSTKEYLDKHGTPKNLNDLLENFDLCIRTSYLNLPDIGHILRKAKHLNTISDSAAVIFRLILNNGGISIFPEWMKELSSFLIPIDTVNFELDRHFVAFSPKKNVDSKVLLYIEHTKKANQHNILFEEP